MKRSPILLCLAVCLGVLTSPEIARAAFEFSISPQSGSRNIRFEASAPGGLLRNEQVNVSVQSDEAVPYRVYLTVHQPLMNETGKALPQGAFFVFSPSSPIGTLRTQLETPLTLGQIPLYTSNSAGASDSFILVFNVRVPESQPGGTYHTQISFTAEPANPTGQVMPVTRTVDVQVEIRPVFNIIIRNEKGGRQIDLGRIGQNSPSGGDILNIRIESNAGVAYRVIQEMPQPLVSQEGVFLDESLLRFTAQGTGNGTLASTGASSAVGQPPLIYTSDEAGQSDEFQVRYAITPDAAAKAGLYAGTITLRFESQSPLIPADAVVLPVKLEIEPVFDLNVEVRDALGIHFGMVKPGENRPQERQITLTVRSNLGAPYQISQVVSRRLMTQEGVTLPDDAFQFYGSNARSGTVTVTSPSAVREGESVVFISDKKGTPESLLLKYTLTIPPQAKAGDYGSELKYSITTL
jgi:hypothetical protein